MADSYFVAGPLSEDGKYASNRGIFDGAIGFVDGAASLINSAGHVVTEVSDIREDYTRGQRAVDELRLDIAEREQDSLLSFMKVERGDNVQLYYAGAAVAVLALFLLR